MTTGFNTYVVKPDWIYNGPVPEPRIFHLQKVGEKIAMVSNTILDYSDRLESGDHCNNTETVPVYKLVPGPKSSSLKTWGPFKVVEVEMSPINNVTGGVEGTIVLNSNDQFAISYIESRNDHHFFLHKNLNDGDKRVMLHSKVSPVTHEVNIVGYKSSDIKVSPEDVVEIKEEDQPKSGKRAPLPQRFSEANKSKVDYFIVDINCRTKWTNSYVLIPIPSLFEINYPESTGSGVGSNSFKTVFNLAPSDFKDSAPYSVSSLDQIFAVDLEIIRGNDAAQDLRPSGDTGSGSSGSEPAWPLFLAVALCVAVIVIWKRGGSLRAGRFL